MAGNLTVASMTAASALAGTELVYTVQGGNDRKSTPAQIGTYVTNNIGTGPAILTSPSAAVLQVGAADAASPTAQTLSFQSVAAGNANTAAVNTTIKGSLSNGSGAGGDIILQTTQSSAGSGSQNNAATALTLKGGTQIVNVATQMGVGTTGAATTSINVAAGTTTVAPVTLNSGTNLTTAAAGAVEFDGTCFYATAAASSRQVLKTEQFVRIVADYTLTDVNTAQKAFNATSNGAITVQGSTTYFVQGQYFITNTGTTSHTWGILFGGTATITALGTMLVANGYTATSNALTTSSSIAIVGASVSSVTVMTSASTSATENVVIQFSGFINVNGAGTIIPQVKLSAATSGTELMKAGSYCLFQPRGSNTVASVGNWS